MSKQLALTVNGVVTGVRIDATASGPRLFLEGVQADATTGATVAAFSEDVTAQLTPAQKAALTTIVTRAQAWIDSK